MMGAMSLILAGALAVVLAAAVGSRRVGFLSQRPKHYAGAGPNFDPRVHLSGPTLCEGVIYGPFGRVVSRFDAKMEGSWQGNSGVLTERFHFDSGTEQTREWRLTLNDDGTIRAEADDLVGTGIGRHEGFALQMRYRIRLPQSAGRHVLDVTDWMYLAPNGTIINRSQFRNYGIMVAELVATIRKGET